MTVGDYTRLADTEIHFETPHAERESMALAVEGFVRDSVVGRSGMRKRHQVIFRF